MKTIIFTDLDGTLLSEKYSFQETKPAIDKLLALHTSIVFCSSKTKTELEFYQKKMNLIDPFISENGAAIYIPKDILRKITPIQKKLENTT
jgi:mannosyl-3-phosphoglycerate phosphatase